MAFVKATQYLIEKYQENEMKALTTRLALKYAQPAPATLPSARGPENSNVFIPKAPRVPIIEEFESGVNSTKWDDETETPTIKTNFVPMSNLEMINSPGKSAVPTMSPNQLEGLSKYQIDLIGVCDRMWAANIFTAVYAGKLIEKIRINENLKNIEKDIEDALLKDEMNAINFLNKIKAIQKSLTNLKK